MKISKYVKNTICLSLAFLAFSMQSVLVYAVETNFWKERIDSSQSLQKPKFLVGTVAQPLLEEFARTPSLFPKSTSSGIHVFHVQDIHDNTEAQSNIARTLDVLVQQQQIDLIALEGGFGSYDLSPFTSKATPENKQLIADYLLSEKLISGPIYSLMVAKSNCPRVVGIDDASLHEKNVQAFLSSRQHKDQASQELSSWKLGLLGREQQLNSPLQSLQKMSHAYHAGKLPMGRYLQFLLSLDRSDKTNSSQMALYLKADQLESSLAFDRVERERTIFINSLMSTLSPEESAHFVQRAQQLQQGLLTQVDFYHSLEELAKKKNVSLKSYPSLAAYFRYMSMSYSLVPEKLFQEITKTEDRVKSQLCRNPWEVAVVTEANHYDLTTKLLEFSLSREEWDRYKKQNSSESWAAPFEDFYRWAEKRDQAMSDRLLRDIQQFHARRIVLVTGGFHQEGLRKALAQKNMTVYPIVPKVKKIETEQGPVYLNAFAQEKTPLEKMFLGEKLFLAKNPIAPFSQHVLVPALETALTHVPAQYADVGGDPAFHVDEIHGDAEGGRVQLSRNGQTIQIQATRVGKGLQQKLQVHNIVTLPWKHKMGSSFQFIMRGPSAWMYAWSHRQSQKNPGRNLLFSPRRMAALIGFLEEVLGRAVFQEGLFFLAFLQGDLSALLHPTPSVLLSFVIAKLLFTLFWSILFSSELFHGQFFRGKNPKLEKIFSAVEDESVRRHVFFDTFSVGVLLLTVQFVFLSFDDFPVKSLFAVFSAFYFLIGLHHAEHNLHAYDNDGILWIEGEPTLSSSLSMNFKALINPDKLIERKIYSGKAMALSHYRMNGKVTAERVSVPEFLFGKTNPEARVAFLSKGFRFNHVFGFIFNSERGQRLASLLGDESSTQIKISEGLKTLLSVTQPINRVISGNFRWVILIDPAPHFLDGEKEKFDQTTPFLFHSGMGSDHMTPTIYVPLSVVTASAYDPTAFLAGVEQELRKLSLLNPGVPDYPNTEKLGSGFEPLVKAVRVLETAMDKYASGKNQEAIDLLTPLKENKALSPLMRCSILREQVLASSRMNNWADQNDIPVLTEFAALSNDLFRRSFQFHPRQQELIAINHYFAVRYLAFHEILKARRVKQSNATESADHYRNAFNLLTTHTSQYRHMVKSLLIIGCHQNILFELACEACLALGDAQGVLDLLTVNRGASPVELKYITQRSRNLEQAYRAALSLRNSTVDSAKFTDPSAGRVGNAATAADPAMARKIEFELRSPAQENAIDQVQSGQELFLQLIHDLVLSGFLPLVTNQQFITAIQELLSFPLRVGGDPSAVRFQVVVDNGQIRIEAFKSGMESHPVFYRDLGSRLAAFNWKLDLTHSDTQPDRVFSLTHVEKTSPPVSMVKPAVEEELPFNNHDGLKLFEPALQTAQTLVQRRREIKMALHNFVSKETRSSTAPSLREKLNALRAFFNSKEPMELLVEKGIVGSNALWVLREKYSRGWPVGSRGTYGGSVIETIDELKLLLTQQIIDASSINEERLVSILVDQYLFDCIQWVSTRLWEKHGAAKSEKVRQVQTLLDNLQTGPGSSGQFFARTVASVVDLMGAEFVRDDLDEYLLTDQQSMDIPFYADIAGQSLALHLVWVNFTHRDRSMARDQNAIDYATLVRLFIDRLHAYAELEKEPITNPAKKQVVQTLRNFMASDPSVWTMKSTLADIVAPFLIGLSVHEGTAKNWLVSPAQLTELDSLLRHWGPRLVSDIAALPSLKPHQSDFSELDVNFAFSSQFLLGLVITSILHPGFEEISIENRLGLDAYATAKMPAWLAHLRAVVDQMIKKEAQIKPLYFSQTTFEGIRGLHERSVQALRGVNLVRPRHHDYAALTRLVQSSRGGTQDNSFVRTHNAALREIFGFDVMLYERPLNDLARLNPDTHSDLLMYLSREKARLGDTFNDQAAEIIQKFDQPAVANSGATPPHQHSITSALPWINVGVAVSFILALPFKLSSMGLYSGDPFNLLSHLWFLTVVSYAIHEFSHFYGVSRNKVLWDFLVFNAIFSIVWLLMGFYFSDTLLVLGMINAIFRSRDFYKNHTLSEFFDSPMHFSRGSIWTAGLHVQGARGADGLHASLFLATSSLLVFLIIPSWQIEGLAMMIVNLIFAASIPDWKDYFSSRHRKRIKTPQNFPFTNTIDKNAAAAVFSTTLARVVASDMENTLTRKIFERLYQHPSLIDHLLEGRELHSLDGVEGTDLLKALNRFESLFRNYEIILPDVATKIEQHFNRNEYHGINLEQVLQQTLIEDLVVNELEEAMSAAVSTGKKDFYVIVDEASYSEVRLKNFINIISKVENISVTFYVESASLAEKLQGIIKSDWKATVSIVVDEFNCFESNPKKTGKQFMLSKMDQYLKTHQDSISGDLCLFMASSCVLSPVGLQDDSILRKASFQYFEETLSIIDANFRGVEELYKLVQKLLIQA